MLRAQPGADSQSLKGRRCRVNAPDTLIRSEMFNDTRDALTGNINGRDNENFNNHWKDLP